jgi:hypothetical protein
VSLPGVRKIGLSDSRVCLAGDLGAVDLGTGNLGGEEQGFVLIISA